MVRERMRFAARRVKAKPPSKSLRQQRVSSRPKKHRAAAEPVRPPQVGGRSLLRNVGVNQDVTERRKAGRALRESEERLHLALETAELGMWEWRPDTDSFYFDERECRLFGVTPATAPKTSAEFIQFVHPEDREIVRENSRKGLRTDQSYATEFRARLPNGSYRWLSSTGRIARDASGGLEIVRGITLDISERKQAETALRESEERYRIVAETAADAFVTIDTESRILFANRSIERIFGYKPEELVGQKLSTLIPHRLRERHLHGFEHYVRTGVRNIRWEGIELPGLHKDGHEIPLEISFGESSAGGQRIFAGIIRDISERKQTETALRESEERLRTALQAASMGAWEWDAATKHITQDQNFQNLFGVSPTEFPGLPEGVLRYIVPEDRTRFLETFQRCSATGERYEVEFRICRPDGEIRWISDQGRATLDDSGRVVRFRGVAQDVTERRQAERALRESEERLHLALETAELGMWEWQPDTDSFYFDERECRLLGMTSATAPKTSAEFIQFVHPEDREIVREAARRAFRTGESSAGEVRVRLPDGTYRWLSSTGRIVRDASGKIEIVRGITLDLTHRRKLEEQLRLAQKMEAIGQLAGGVAHDFNNLLTVIRGHTELILDGAAGNQELERNATAVQEAAGRAASITQQLLAFSRRQVLQPRALEISQVVRKSAELLRRLIQANIELQMETASEPLWIQADSSQLEQVLMNLVVNARDAMPTGGTLKLTTERLPAGLPAIRPQAGMPDVNYTLLTVHDTGVGMDPFTQAHIFDPFFTTKETGRGTGLGMSMVYGIVKQSNGWIFVESEQGKGSAFHIFFPETDAPSEVEIPKSAHPGKPSGNETILIAEDQEGVRTLAVDFLTSLGYKVLAAENGASALEMAERQSGPIHLLLTDAMMPRMSGLALSRRLRERRPAIKVLFISGYATDAAALEGIAMQNEPFLQKPFSMEELARKVRGLLD